MAGLCARGSEKDEGILADARGTGSEYGIGKGQQRSGRQAAFGRDAARVGNDVEASGWLVAGATFTNPVRTL
jgi:hypothetical protein